MSKQLKTLGRLPKAVVWDNNQLYLLDQTLLPLAQQMIRCDTVASVFEAIQALKVRGAPAIGIAAAYGLLLESQNGLSLRELKVRAKYLISARPTAVNLAWSINRMVAVASQSCIAQSSSSATSDSESDLLDLALMIKEATLIYEEDKASCKAIGDHGFQLLGDKTQLLTHCNAGSLAVSEYGTALAPIYRAHEAGKNIHVYVDETRPLLQGARLTSFELAQHGVSHTLITDSMAAHVVSQGKVEAVIVGADRVARNGDTANKIGTLSLAIVCHHFNVPFYVACPLSTIDIETVEGSDIEIETRDPDEVRHFASTQTSLSDTPVYNPAFDVTPAALVTALITEKGVIHSPNASRLEALFAER